MNEVDLTQFDALYGKVDTPGRDEGGYTELPPGEYTMMIVGVGWLDVRPSDPQGFLGMGPCWRLRVVGGLHAGRPEQYRQFLLRKHPARGLLSVEANSQAKAFFTRDCKRIGLSAPEVLSDIPDWTEPLWKIVRVEIRLKEGGNGKTYRNVYLNGEGRNPEGVKFRAEHLTENRWSIEEASPSSALSDEIPF